MLSHLSEAVEFCYKRSNCSCHYSVHWWLFFHSSDYPEPPTNIEISQTENQRAVLVQWTPAPPLSVGRRLCHHRLCCVREQPKVFAACCQRDTDRESVCTTAARRLEAFEVCAAATGSFFDSTCSCWRVRI